MKKQSITLALMILSSVFAFGQDWITMTTPQSAILGAPVSEIKNGDIDFDFKIKYDKNPTLETRESAESLQEYQDKFRNFVTKYFNTSKVSLQTITANNLKVRTLSQESIDKLQVGSKYIYEGVAADSVTITLSTKKEFSADISKAVKDISTAITGPQASQIVEKVPPFLDSISYTQKDSIFYKLTIKNPNVYYKVKVIKLKKNGNLCNCDWEKNCFLYFTNRVNDDFPRTLKLEDDFTGDKSTTVSRYPEFCGKDRKDVQYSLKVIKETDGLHLWVYETNATIDNSAKQKIEVPYKDKLSNGKTIREWRLERTYMYRFAKRGIIKNIFIEVSARQVDENSLEILNWKDGKNSLGDNALTCLKYPEFKGKYVTK
ncbi:MAG: hypothetical protein ACK5U7_12040 [Bacteroidota bacterium]|jgi:hypothetical protein